MIIACPACTTRYVVPDSAIGLEGRTVRCAKCRHSWFQDGPTLELAAEAAIAPAPTPAPAPPPPPPPPAVQPIAQHEPEPTARPGFSFAEEPQAKDPDTSYIREPDIREPDETPPPEPLASEHIPPPPVSEYDEAAEDAYSQFDPEPPFRPRRNILKLWTYAAAIFALFAVGTVLGVSYWGLPDWVPVSRPTFGLGQSDLVLDFPGDKQDRRQLPSGTEFFDASGTVTNVGQVTQTLPTILIVLRDERDRIVYTGEVAPPKRTLAPGETVTIKQAFLDVPKAAKVAEFGWKPG